MALKRIPLIRGDSHILNLTLKKSDGTPWCLKNWSVFFTMKTEHSLPDSQASLQKIVTTFADSVSGTSGVAAITLLPADTVDLADGEYDFDIAVTTAAGEDLTILRGKIDLQYDVTRTVGTAGTAT
jgi:hypothetical protein